MTTPTGIRQTTIAAEIELKGTGLHTGVLTTVRLKAAPEGYGRRFIRSDVAGSPELTATDLDVTCAPGRTALCKDGTSVETVEHVLAALAGLGVDNVRIEIDGPEPPSGDGSALIFAEAIQGAGIVQQDAAREAYVIDEPVVIEQDGARVIALPLSPAASGGSLSRYGYALSYRDSTLARGWQEIDLTPETFLREVARARTFCMAKDVERLKAIGLGRGATHENTLVIDGDVAQGTELRYADEPVRHKLLDLIGDVGLVGAPVVGRVTGYRSGHRQNWQLVRHILNNARKCTLDSARPKPIMTMEDIERILPHRYPFLLVDSVVELEPEKRIVAVKNVFAERGVLPGPLPGESRDAGCPADRGPGPSSRTIVVAICQGRR